jgi:hypothetical protein
MTAKQQHTLNGSINDGAKEQLQRDRDDQMSQAPKPTWPFSIRDGGDAAVIANNSPKKTPQAKAKKWNSY